ncbi:excalibur calcium-binding domain-containing protein [Novosphingobium silvae]|uniref:excalibur calcium-binding domain-containing protein n=1 Tax=Novosphingobium silvae TaxID=2692619 RepID=UPI00301D2FB9
MIQLAWHRVGAAYQPARQSLLGKTYGVVAYRNYVEARAADAAPVRREQLDYTRHLDRDGDGVGCE